MVSNMQPRRTKQLHCSNILELYKYISCGWNMVSINLYSSTSDLAALLLEGSIAKWNTHTGKISNRFQRNLIHVCPHSMLSIFYWCL